MPQQRRFYFASAGPFAGRQRPNFQVCLKGFTVQVLQGRPSHSKMLLRGRVQRKQDQPEW